MPENSSGRDIFHGKQPFGRSTDSAALRQDYCWRNHAAKLSEYISHLPVEADFAYDRADRQGRIVADSQLRWGQQLNLATLPHESTRR